MKTWYFSIGCITQGCQWVDGVPPPEPVQLKGVTTQPCPLGLWAILVPTSFTVSQTSLVCHSLPNYKWNGSLAWFKNCSIKNHLGRDKTTQSECHVAILGGRRRLEVQKILKTTVAFESDHFSNVTNICHYVTDIWYVTIQTLGTISGGAEMNQSQDCFTILGDTQSWGSKDLETMKILKTTIAFESDHFSDAKKQTFGM